MPSPYEDRLGQAGSGLGGFEEQAGGGGGGGALGSRKVFDVQRATGFIPDGDSSVTMVNGADYNLHGGALAKNTISRIANSRLTSRGPVGSPQTPANSTVRITDPDNVKTSLTLTRAGTSGDCAFAMEFISYIGTEGKANEMMVEQNEVLEVTDALSANGTAIPSLTANSSVMVVITSQSSAETSASFVPFLWTTDWNAGKAQPVVQRLNLSSTESAWISYAAVRWGSNWTVSRMVNEVA